MTTSPVDLAHLARAIDDSYVHFTGRSLVNPGTPRGSQTDDLQDGDVLAALDHLPEAILCHDRSADPVFIYVNLTAARLWGIDRDKFLGMPSRLTAPDNHRGERQRALHQVDSNGYTAGYSGIRRAATGRVFQIVDAELWNVVVDEVILGQAARIPRWEDVTSTGHSHD